MGSSPGQLTDRELALVDRLTAALTGFGRQSAAVSSQLSKRGYDKTSMMLLGALIAGGPMRSSALAEAVYSDPSTISRQVANLVKAGLVERRADQEDGRASLLAVSEEGRRLVRRQHARRNAAYARMLGHWTDEDRTRFVELLERFVDEHEKFLPALVAEFANAADNPGES
jgi:DNA-binding MarR family transcriptional regulator